MPTKITLLYILAGELCWQSQKATDVGSNADSYEGGSFNTNGSGLQWSNCKEEITKDSLQPVEVAS